MRTRTPRIDACLVRSLMAVEHRARLAAALAATDVAIRGRGLEA